MVAVASFSNRPRASYQTSAPLHIKKEAHMKRREEYRAKVTNDTGLIRGRVPCPLLQVIGARPGDYIIFRPDDSGKVVMRLSRAKKKSGGKRRS
jgi:hypothetical protein